jgi:hypothetical protein
VWEITPDNKVAWVFRMNLMSKAAGMMAQAFNPAKIMYYPSSYKGIANLFTRGGVKIAGCAVAKPAGALNPVINALAGRLDFSNISGCEISLLSLHGRKIASLSPKTDRFSLDTRAFPKGAYCVKVTSGKQVKANRMITLAF